MIYAIALLCLILVVGPWVAVGYFLNDFVRELRRDSDAMLARKAAGFEPRSGRSAGPQDIAQKG